MKNSLLKPGAWRKWTVIFLCWTGLALLFTSQSYLSQARFANNIEWKRPLLVSLLWCYSWGILTPLIIRFLKRFPLQLGKRSRSIAVHSVGTAFFIFISTIIFAIGRWSILDPWPRAGALLPSFGRLITLEVLPGLMLYSLIVGIIQSIDYYLKYRDRELRASNLKARLIRVQLDALRTQLHPHFLFNTLNSISVLMRRDIDAADRMLLQLSNLLRVTLSGNVAHEISLGQELEILERYLEIEQIRFQDRLTVRMDIDQAALDALVPQLFFQPLVENALRHGIADRESGGVIDIRAGRENGMVHLQVRDNGHGLNHLPGTLIEGVGLSNTRSRLDHLYGSESRFEVYNAEGGGVIVAATFPFHTQSMLEAESKR
jgi:two-component sensor histidine kinase